MFERKKLLVKAMERGTELRVCNTKPENGSKSDIINTTTNR